MKQISSSIYQISLGAVNVFVIEDKSGLTLVDTGVPGSKDKIFEAIRRGGKNKDNIRQIILTHLHPDHAGSVAEIKKVLDVPVYAHETDALLIEQGIGSRQMVLSPGILNKIMYNLFVKNAGSVISPVKIGHKLKDGDLLPIAGGIQVIHTPGHSAGHICLLVKEEGVLIAADICSNFGSPGYSIVYENREMGRQSILKAAGYKFDKAVFGHGSQINSGAAEKLKAKFSRPL